MVPTKRSAIALARGARIGVWVPRTLSPHATCTYRPHRSLDQHPFAGRSAAPRCDDSTAPQGRLGGRGERGQPVSVGMGEP